jgi:hypothetical protein
VVWIGSVDSTTTAGHFLYIADCQLEVGGVATDFERESITLTLEKCMRYYERFTANIADGEFVVGMCANTTAFSGILRYKVRKRAAPTLSFTAADTFIIRHATTSTTGSSGPGVSAGSDVDSSGISLNVASGLTAGQAAIMRKDGTDTAYIEISSEL